MKKTNKNLVIALALAAFTTIGLVSCGEEKAAEPATTTEAAAAPAESAATPAPDAAAAATKAVEDTAKMDKADTKPVTEGVKKN